MRRSNRFRRLFAWVGVVPVAVLLSGCGVATGVAVAVRPDGTGTVGVTVSLDRAAQTQVGDLASQLQTADLIQAGWSVTGPHAGPAGTEVVSATKAFTTLADAGADVAALAGSGSGGTTRPFRLSLSRHRTFWHTTMTVDGAVDLTCGLACFGDPGLGGQLGSIIGLNPGALAARSGSTQTPAQVLAFSFAITLPGHVRAAAPGVVAGSTVTWKPVLGQRLMLAASSQSVNNGAVVVVVASVGLLGLLVLVVVLVLVVRRRGGRSSRRRVAPRHRRR